jgi:hypothetical protein
VAALQDLLHIRPFDPRTQVKAFISALRGVTVEDTGKIVVDPVLIQPGVERC